MARKPSSKKQSSLSPALDHVEVACHGVAVYAPYCLFSTGWLIGYDGIVAAGHRVVEDINVAPHTETMRAALARAGNPYSLTVMPAGNVVVRGDKVRVDVPGFAPDGIPNAQPDRPMMIVTEKMAKALIDVSKIAQVRHDKVIASSVQLKSNTCVATNGSTILEAWHGLEMPCPFLLPKEFIDALAKLRIVPTHAGFSNETFTFWFGQERWLRTNVYQATYPDTDIIFAKFIADCREMRAIPVETLQAVETLKPFVDDGMILIHTTGINTKTDLSGANYNFEHFWPLPTTSVRYPYDGMRMLAMHGSFVGMTTEGCYWYGKELRGLSACF